jgi:hypothetical protein
MYFLSKHISNVNIVEGFFSVLEKFDVNVQVYYNDLFAISGKHERSEVSCVFKYSKTLWLL